MLHHSGHIDYWQVASVIQRWLIERVSLSDLASPVAWRRMSMSVARDVVVQQQRLGPEWY